MSISNLDSSAYLSALNPAPNVSDSMGSKNNDDSQHHAAHASNFLHKVGEWFKHAFSDKSHGDSDL